MELEYFTSKGEPSKNNFFEQQRKRNYWRGFITASIIWGILFAILGNIALNYLESEPDYTMTPEQYREYILQETAILEVLEPTVSATIQSPIIKKTVQQPAPVQASVPVQPIQPVITYRTVIEYRPMDNEPEEDETDNQDIEFRSLCNDLEELTGLHREDYPRAMKSYRACADQFITAGQKMSNSGLMGSIFVAQLKILREEYQSLTS